MPIAGFTERAGEDDALRLKRRIVRAQVSQRRREESGADEQRHRQRDLCDEQAAPEASQRADGPTAAAQALVDVHRDRLPRGHDANREADAYGQQCRRGDHAGIRRQRQKLRTRASEHEGCRHGSDDPPRQRDRTGERHGRQQDPVDQQLPEHAPRASTQCETNRDLVAPGQRARQGQARKVGARDRQENPHQGQEHPERGAVLGAQTRKS